jgi:hypothetical protein
MRHSGNLSELLALVHEAIIRTKRHVPPSRPMLSEVNHGGCEPGNSFFAYFLDLHRVGCLH